MRLKFDNFTDMTNDAMDVIQDTRAELEAMKRDVLYGTEQELRARSMSTITGRNNSRSMCDFLHLSLFKQNRQNNAIQVVVLSHEYKLVFTS